jgi:hypothetical protein
MQFRVGVHVGDVIVDGNKLLGDGVNTAARWKALPSLEQFVSRLSSVTTYIGNKLPRFFDLVSSRSRISHRRSAEGPTRLHAVAPVHGHMKRTIGLLLVHGVSQCGSLRQLRWSRLVLG